MIIDRLYDRVDKKGHVCVGLDTDLSYLPEFLIKKHSNISDSIFEFNKRIIDSTKEYASCFKVQIAYYEAYGIDGMLAYKKTLEYLRSEDQIIIADIKRGDISKTAEMYAKAHFEGDFESDFITVNPYMGMDSIEPYLDYVKNKEKGLFVLVRTSNPGAKDIEYIETSTGSRVFKEVGKKIQKLGEDYIGDCGYSSLGGVVGCTHKDEGIEMRKELDKTFFLIPGYGAQGGGAKDVVPYLKEGNGGVVNSSRGILLAYKKAEGDPKDFDEYSRIEAKKMQEAILNEVK
ncbi:MAG: orotidine-5'-phosphate decarboxylase [Andreesenia angusta]|nr:orotidine-5'-phosphate decarboxylase [Andreesenia angusta]